MKSIGWIRIQSLRSAFSRCTTMHTTQQAADACWGLLGLEHPADPHSYLPETQQCPESGSLLAWPEIQHMIDREGCMLAQFDQGALGHRKQKQVLS